MAFPVALPSMNSSQHSLQSITVNGRFLSQSITGVQRYAFELLTALDALLSSGSLDRIPVTVLAPPNVKERPSWSSIHFRQVGRFTGRLWEQLDLPFHARGTLLFTPCGGAPLVHPHHVLTIHDAGPFSTPNAYTAGYRYYYKSLQRMLCRTAAHVITVSEFSRQEIIGFLRIPSWKISSTLLSGEHILRYQPDPSVLARHRLQPGRYVLAVGSRNPNKNLRGVILAAAHIKSPAADFAIAGGENRTIFTDSQIASAHVKELGFVNDHELRSLYENAACLVFPSFYEGFGLPPLEALNVGCPVVVARTASLPEVLADAAVYCDPYSSEDIARQIRSVLRGEHPPRESLSRYASQFTWERCARETWRILEKALQGA